MPTPQIYVVQLSATSWLVLDEVVRPRWLIARGPLVHKGTRETLIMDRVELWNIDSAKRATLSVHDGLELAKKWCANELAKQAAFQSRNHGLDPATGRPLTRS